MIVLVFLSLGAARCARPPATLPPLEPVAIPFSPADAGCCITLEQTVVVTTPRGHAAFEVVVETHGDEVVIVGFTSYGVRAFVVVHRATGLEVDASTLPEVRGIPFDRVVRDVYAAFLLPANAAPADASVRLTDHVEGGRLVTRDVVFDSAAVTPDTVTVRYGGGFPIGGDPPTDVVVDHAGIGLRVDVTTRSVTRSDRP